MDDDPMMILQCLVLTGAQLKKEGRSSGTTTVHQNPDGSIVNGIAWLSGVATHYRQPCGG